MSFSALKRIFHQKTLFCAHVNSPALFISTTKTLFAKKRFVMKNNFAFQNKFPQNENYDTEEKANSYVHFESSDNCDRTSNSNRYLSADLLSGESAYPKQNSAKRKVQSKKINKPPLSYQGEILFGVHPVYLALLQKKRTFYRLFALNEIDSPSPNNRLKAEIVKLTNSMDIPVSFIDSKGLRILAPGAVHQGICLDASCLPSITWKEDQSINDIQKQILWLVLDQVIDPMNVGAVIRSAYYFGVDKIFTVRGNSCKLSPTVSKASSGALEVMNIYQIDNLEDFIKQRKASDWCVVSTVAYLENKSEFNNSLMNVEDFKTSKPTVLILGNEGRGISEDIFKLCDSLITIQPGKALYQGIDSLNVSVAAGVLLYVLNSCARNVER